ncbi:MAG: type II toxin-antitoxin system VapC family toxin [Gallionellaceae bacterium]|jgi:predicted nucleic acid-binding protein
MIVIDANILIYSLIDCDYSPLVHKLREKDSDWRTTALCLHETLNVLATYQRREVLTLTQCRKLLDHAERFIKVAQCEIAMDAALAVAAKYAITGYDAQYVALAQSLNAPLITEDRKLRNAVPGVAFSMQEFLAQ